MEANAISRSDAFVTPATSQRAKSLESNDPTIETRPNDVSSKVSGETVKLSDTSVKLSSSSPVKSSDKSAPIENRDQAQQVLNQLIADFQSNPSQAQGAHDVFASAVKSLLG